VRLAPLRPNADPILRHALSRASREIPTRYLYDATGAAFFEQIVSLPEYYQARTESALLARHASELVASVAPRALVELGVGSGDKTRYLVDALARLGGGRAVIVQDVHAASATRAAMRLDALHDHVVVRAASGDFLRQLPRPPRGPGRLWALLGSTFGNLGVDTGRTLLRRIAARSDARDTLLLGLDLAHDPAALERAYNDSAGVTAAFNLNALRHLNRAADADFDTGAFEHVARFDRARSRIEMLLRARRSMDVTVRSLGLRFHLARGAALRTEISEKHTRQSLADRAEGTGLRLERFVADPTSRYALAVLRVHS